jgi:hypothetical protein
MTRTTPNHRPQAEQPVDPDWVWDDPQVRATMEMVRRADAAGKTMSELQWDDVSDLADIWPELSTLWWKNDEEKAPYIAEQRRQANVSAADERG